MKFIPVLLIFISVFACKPPKQTQISGNKDTTISELELVQLIDTLSSDYFEGRETGSTGIDKAADYIENYLNLLKIKPFFKQFRDSFLVGDVNGFNIIGIIEGTDPILKNEFVILSAHYDHIGKLKGRSDSVYNGANDNASGVSTVLNIAKIVSENKMNKRGVIIALFSGEEMGLKGSEHFAKKIKNDKNHSYYFAVNIDMIGSVLTNEEGKVYLSGYNKSNMSEIFNNYINDEGIVNWKKESAYGLFSLSDNYPIYEILKIPAHTFCTFDFNNYKHYHNTSDELVNLNIQNTLKIANNICIGFIKAANSREKEIVLKEE